MRITKKLAVFSLIGLITFGLGVTLHRVRHPATRCSFELSAWKVLLSFENQDLEGLDEQSTRIVKSAIEMATAPIDTTTPHRFEPRIFRKISNTKGELRYILVQESPLLMIPGSQSIRVHIFDATGKVLNSTQFDTGNRMAIRSIHLRKNYLLNSEALTIDTEYWIGGNHSHQYYVVVGDELRLVYVGDGFRVDINNYQNPDMTIGPRLNHSADEWESDLQSTDDARVLSALTWLAGYHWDGQESPYDEDRSDGEKVRDLCARESVRRRLADLKNSTNFVIKQTAETVVRDKH